MPPNSSYVPWERAEAETQLRLVRRLKSLRAEAAQARARDLWRYRDDPVGFHREVLGIEPWAEQEAILRDLWQSRARVAVPACFGSGKTFVGAGAVRAWVATDPSAIAICTASTGRTVSRQLWGELRGSGDNSRLPGRILPDSPEWKIAPKNYAIGFATSDIARFTGWHGARVLVVIDEASGVAPAIWEAVEGLMVGGEAAVLALGNPMEATGPFYEAATSPLWRLHTISALDTPNVVAGRTVIPGMVTREWVDEMRIKWGEGSPLWISKVLGQFPDLAGRHLVTLMSFAAAVDREGIRPVPDGELRASLDVARFGTNFSCVVVRRGRMVLSMQRAQGLSGTACAGWAYRVLSAAGCRRVTVDADGLGGPVADILRAEHRDLAVEDFHGGAVPSDEEMFSNARAEMWWGLHDRFADGQIDIMSEIPDIHDVEQLRAEVTAPTYSHNAKGQIVVESKDSLERRGVPSPDMADALAMAFHEPAGRAKSSFDWLFPVCPRCGKPNQREAWSCRWCGQDLREG